jgi:hypothetical protein
MPQGVPQGGQQFVAGLGKRDGGRGHKTEGMTDYRFEIYRTAMQ